MRSLLATLVLLAACAGQTPDPVEPGPVPDPAGDTHCDRACARGVQLGCPFAADPERCVNACNRFEREAEVSPELGWRPACMAAASSCDAAAACRGGQ